MRKDILILLFILIPAAFFMIFVSRNLSPIRNNSLAATTPYPTVSIASSEIINRDSITPSASRNIEIISPLTGDYIKSGFSVKGNARTYENTVNIRLLDSNGNVLSETFAYANALDVGQFGPFEKSLTFNSGDSNGNLEVFQYSAKDGSEIDKVTIPVVFIKQ